MTGRWWDENWYVVKGYRFIQDINMGNFSDPFWYEDGTDHPPLSSYFYGLAGYSEFLTYAPRTIMNALPGWQKDFPVFRYDLTNPRLVSVAISTFSILLLFFFGLRYFSFFVAVASASIMAMLPHFLGYSQLVDLESWVMLFFTACVFSYYLYLETNKRRFLILTGILTGLNLSVKQSGVLILLFYILTYFVWKKLTRSKKITPMHLLYITLLSLLVFVLVCPIPWFHIPQFIHYTEDLWFKNSGLIPELIFGRHMGAHFFYYILAFLITTPGLILLLLLSGTRVAYQKKKWKYAGVIIWFLVPFFLTVFHERQNMVRYIIQVYAPVAVLSAMSLEYLSRIINKNELTKYAGLVAVLGYLLVILVRISPFYLDYYNELVGGTKNVYEKKLFFLGWFGEGLRQPGIYIAQHAKKNDTIGLALDPPQTLYTIPTLRYSLFNPEVQYKYVVVNYFNIIRIGFNPSVLKRNYRLVYQEKVEGAVLASVYKHI